MVNRVNLKIGYMNTIDLNGAWEFQPDWHSPRIGQLPDGLFKKDEWLPATAPGTVHADLMAAEKIPGCQPRNDDCGKRFSGNADTPS
jgi:hypothetical protein